MSDSLPPEIEVTEISGGVHYRLPKRQLGKLRFVGLGMVVVGAAIALAFLAGTVVLATPLAGDIGWGATPLFLKLVIGFAFLAMALQMIRLVRMGSFVLAGHSEVELSAGKLWAIERAGPFWLRRGRPVEQLSQLVVRFPAGDQPLPGMARWDVFYLSAECSPDGPLSLGVAYPREMLLLLAQELARRCDEVRQASAQDTARRGVRVIDATAAGAKVEPEHAQEAEEVLHQPVGSEVAVDEHPDGITVTIPPAGIWRGSRGLILFSAVWLAIVATFTLLLVLTGGGGQGPGLWILLPFLAVFWTIGIAVLLAAINMGRRRAVLAVVGDALLVLQTGMFGGKRREWARAQVRQIVVGPSGLTVNETPVLELQVHDGDGRHFGLLAGRDEAELKWIASLLRRWLRVWPQEVDATTGRS